MNAEYYCPILTAFHEDGSFDEGSQHRMYDRLIDAGIDGIVVLGSSGEFSGLTVDVCREIGLDAIAYVGGRTKVYVGTGRLDIDETVNLSNEMIGAGATGVIVVGPYYCAISNEGIYRYFDAVAQQVQGDILIYNYPDNTGFDVPVSVLKRLVDANSNIVGIKDTVESATHTQRYIHAIKPRHPEFRIYSGFDNNLVPVVFSGGDGVIAAMSNMMPRTCSAWIRALKNDDVAAISKIHATVSRLMEVYSISVPFMPAMKRILAELGMDIPRFCRPPALPLSVDEERRALEVAQFVKENCNE